MIRVNEWVIAGIVVVAGIVYNIYRAVSSRQLRDGQKEPRDEKERWMQSVVEQLSAFPREGWTKRIDKDHFEASDTTPGGALVSLLGPPIMYQGGSVRTIFETLVRLEPDGHVVPDDNGFALRVVESHTTYANAQHSESVSYCVTQVLGPRDTMPWFGCRSSNRNHPLRRLFDELEETVPEGRTE